MAQPTRRYPFSTQDGNFVPTDILRPVSALLLEVDAFTSVPIAIPNGVEVFTIFCSCDTIIQFGTDIVTATDLVPGAIKDRALYVPSDMVILCSPAVDVTHFALIGYNGSVGSAIIQFIESWNSLSTRSQHERR